MREITITIPKRLEPFVDIIQSIEGEDYQVVLDKLFVEAVCSYHPVFAYGFNENRKVGYSEASKRFVLQRKQKPITDD